MAKIKRLLQSLFIFVIQKEFDNRWQTCYQAFPIIEKNRWGPLAQLGRAPDS